MSDNAALYRRTSAPGVSQLVDEIRKLHAALREVQGGAILQGAGIGATETGLTVDSALDVFGRVTAWGDNRVSFAQMDNGTLRFQRRDLDVPGSMHATEGSSGRTTLRIVPPRSAPSDDTVLYLEGPTDGQNGLITVNSGGQLQLYGQSAVFLRALAGTLTLTGSENAALRALAGSLGLTAENGQVSIQSGEQIILESGTTTSLRTEETLFLTSHTANVQANADQTIFLTAGNNIRATADQSVYLVASNGVVQLEGAGGFVIQTPNAAHRIRSAGNDVIVDAPTRFYVAANFYATGTINSGGTKNFAIPHPTRKDRALVHAATESPVAGIEYTGTARLDGDGQARVELPAYFEALAAGDGRTVHLTPVGRPFPVGADPVTGGGFTAYGDPGRTVSWLVKARRGDAGGQFDPEPPLADAGISAPPEPEADVDQEVAPDA